MAHFMADSFYVDDFITGASNVDKGMEIYQKAKQLMKSGGFNLPKRRMNSISIAI